MRLFRILICFDNEPGIKGGEEKERHSLLAHATGYPTKAR
jgi:hypothetical protein